MPVQFPPLEWPEVLVERGPPEDPVDLLTDAARIGGTAAQIIAIRIDPTMVWGPDFKRDVAANSY